MRGIPSAVAVVLVGGQMFTAVSAAGARSCGVTASGDAYCWGDGSPTLVR